MDKSGRQAVLEGQQGSGAWDVLSAMLPTADWSAAARNGELVPAVDGEKIPSPRTKDQGADAPRSPEGEGDDENHHNGETRDDVYDRLSRALCRRGRRHVLLTGLKGVGKTATVRELARRAAAGDIPFLKDRRFLWLDVSNVGPEGSLDDHGHADLRVEPSRIRHVPLPKDSIPTNEDILPALSRETVFQRAAMAT